MRILVVEDDFGSRRILQEYLSPYGECECAIDGNEAIEAFRMALDEENPYRLICLDIMMPNTDGREALKAIRRLEEERFIYGNDRAKIVMTTALNDPKSIVGSFISQCEGYLIKPISRESLIHKLKELALI